MMGKIHLSTVAVLILVSLSTASNAQSGVNSVIRNNNLSANINEEQTSEVFAVSGRRSVFRDFYAVKLNCTPLDWYEVKITKMPSYGSARLFDRNATMHYPPNNARSSCNGKSVRAKAIEYVPPSDFKGTDELTIETITDSGQMRVINFKITVR